MDDLTGNCAREAQRIEEDTLHSAKGHFAVAALWTKMHFWIGIPTTVFAAWAGVSMLKNDPMLGGGLAIGVATLSALSTFLNPSGRANGHLNAGNHYIGLRNQARVFREIELLASDDRKEQTARLLQLGARRDELNVASPQIPAWAYKRAKAGIGAGESQYVVDGKGGREG
jgi:hypothetical protein